MNLIKVDPADYGLEEKKAAAISKMFSPMLAKMVELEVEFNEVINKEITKEVILEAKALRGKYVKVRTGTAKIHTEMKAFYLKGGRFVDGWKNAQIMAGEGNEAKLKEIEKHFENLERERIHKISEERRLLVKVYDIDEPHPGFFGSMKEEVWKPYFAGIKANYENELKAAKQAEIDETERLAKLEAQRKVEIEEKKILEAKLEAAQKEKAAAAKREWEANEASRIKQREANEEARKIAEKAAEEKAEAARKIMVAKLKAEEAAQLLAEEKAANARKEQERLDAITAEKKAARAAELAEAERLASRGDSELMNALISDLNGLIGKYEFKSERNQKAITRLENLILEIITNLKSNK